MLFNALLGSSGGVGVSVIHRNTLGVGRVEGSDTRRILQPRAVPNGKALDSRTTASQ